MRRSSLIAPAPSAASTRAAPSSKSRTKPSNLSRPCSLISRSMP
jgi:hypothetical protein